MLSPGNADLVDSALAKFRADTDALTRSAADAGGWFADLVGTDSTAEALRASAHSSQVLLATLEAKRLTMSDADVPSFLAAAGIDGSWRDVASLITPTGAAETIVTGMARDTGAALQAVGNSALGAIRFAPWMLLAVGALVLFSYARR